MIELFDFRLEGVLAGTFHARRRVNVGRHVEVMRAGLRAGFEHGMIDLAGTGVEGDVNLVFFEKRRQGRRFGGVDFVNDKPAPFGALVENVGKRGVNVRQDDTLEALVAVKLRDRKSTRLNSSHLGISYAVFCLKKKKTT